MKKNELRNGDIVVLSNGSVAVIIGEGKDAYLLFRDNGFEFLDDYYDENMIHTMDGISIMQVFRPEGCSGFEIIDEDWAIWERDRNWFRPISEEEAKAKEAAEAKLEKEREERRKQVKEMPKDLIRIVAQAFYGNRTGTAVTEASLDAFVLGYLDDQINPEKKIDRTIIQLPGSDSVVLIYNKYAEEKEIAFMEQGYRMKPLATIPEMNLEIYSRCIVCRMNQEGKLESLRNGDEKIWSLYLAE